MSGLLEPIGLVILGVLFLMVAHYVWRLYREGFVKDPRRTMSQDVFFIVSSKGALVPLVLAAILVFSGW